jgi:hypothetical protein
MYAKFQNKKVTLKFRLPVHLYRTQCHVDYNISDSFPLFELNLHLTVEYNYNFTHLCLIVINKEKKLVEIVIKILFSFLVI